MISASSGSPATSSRIRSSNLTFPMTPTLRPKLRSRPRISFSMAMAFSCNNLRAVSRVRRCWLAKRLHMNGPEQVDAHHLSNATSIVAVGLVHLRLQERLGVARLDADDREPGRGQPAVEPLGQWAGFEPDPLEPPGRIPEHLHQVVWMAGHLQFATDLARLVQNAQRGLFDRDVEAGIMLHAALLPPMLVAGPTQTMLYHQPEAQHLQQPMRMARSRLPHLLHFLKAPSASPSAISCSSRASSK